ncbi:polymer-forming cytoskeletal protein [Alphaproteobacteria bacterium]|nr:polymer-forming cytoskeletal protein [Alphaproteobacteria bacterium]
MFDNNRKSNEEAPTASLIDKDMRITGSVVSAGDIILAGVLDGEINCRNLVVADNGRLNGTINSQNTEICGEVIGDIVGDKLQIRSTGRFEGAIKVEGIEVEAGADVTAKFKKSRRNKRPAAAVIVEENAE